MGVGTGRAGKTITFSKPTDCRKHNSHKIVDFYCGGKCRSLGRQSARLRGSQHYFTLLRGQLPPAVNMLDKALNRCNIHSPTQDCGGGIYVCSAEQYASIPYGTQRAADQAYFS